MCEFCSVYILDYGLHFLVKLQVCQLVFFCYLIFDKNMPLTLKKISFISVMIRSTMLHRVERGFEDLLRSGDENDSKN